MKQLRSRGPTRTIGYAIAGLHVFEPCINSDPRGSFVEVWNRQKYRKLGLRADFVQDNISLSHRNVLRGLHFQNPKPQGKLIQVLQGEVLDVAVDLRRSSTTFGKWAGLVLSSRDRHQFYIPPGFAHGFVALSRTVLFHYKCTAFYSAEDQLTIRWDDPEINIPWPVKHPLLSDKDAEAPLLRDIPQERLFT